MSVICPNPTCKHVNRDGARFCVACRTPLSASLSSMPGLTGLLPANTLLAGRYLILRKIGQGGMAAVYLATDTRLAGKQWAIKEMSDAAITDPAQKQQAVAMFQREVELLTRLSHRNIPQVVDTFTEGGRYFIVMEYVDGLTLEEWMQQQRNQPFPEAQVKAWFQQLANVLDYLHAQDPPVIFRDLKPSNIMVDRTGTVKLIDFGIARVFSPHKTHDTQSFGTAGYAAPEQYGQQAQSDARSDIYGLGATLYHLLTGYDPSTTPMILPPLDQFQVQISSPMRRVIQRALEHKPAQRWSSVREMAEELGIRLGDHTQSDSTPLPSRTGPVGPTITKRPTTRLLLAVAQMSNRQLAMLAGALALIFALGTAYLTPRISLEAALALPLYLLAGPLAYAASQRRWAAAAAHISVTGAVWLVASHWVDVGDEWWLFAIGLLFSGLAMEGVLWVRNQLQPATSDNMADQAPWWQDCAWLSGMTAVGGLAALGIPAWFGSYNLLRIWFPVSAAFVGALGWFLGDLYYQNVLLKQSGVFFRE